MIGIRLENCTHVELDGNTYVNGDVAVELAGVNRDISITGDQAFGTLNYLIAKDPVDGFSARVLHVTGDAQTRASTLPRTRSSRRVGRNDPCKCGSGVKFKKCCGR